MHYLYKLKNKINGKIYIGQTKNPSIRFSQHKYMAKVGYEYPICRAIKKYGIENFEMEILMSSECKIEICNAEQNYIKELDTTNINIGYNISLGGESGSFGYKHTDEARKKMSNFRKGKHVSPATEFKPGQTHARKPKGLIPWNKDKKYSMVLTNEQIFEIINNPLSSRKIAPIYGVSFSTIKYIRRKFKNE